MEPQKSGFPKSFSYQPSVLGVIRYNSIFLGIKTLIVHGVGVQGMLDFRDVSNVLLQSDLDVLAPEGLFQHK